MSSGQKRKVNSFNLLLGKLPAAGTFSVTHEQSLRRTNVARDFLARKKNEVDCKGSEIRRESEKIGGYRAGLGRTLFFFITLKPRVE